MLQLQQPQNATHIHFREHIEDSQGILFLLHKQLYEHPIDNRENARTASTPSDRLEQHMQVYIHSNYTHFDVRIASMLTDHFELHLNMSMCPIDTHVHEHTLGTPDDHKKLHF
jgi:hypothetical protein